jgi:hypothetical protein
MLSRGAVYVPPCGAYAKRPLIDPDDWGSLGWPQVGEFGWPPGVPDGAYSKDSSKATGDGMNGDG